jgi:gamma-glutamyltranspeptidase
VRILFAGIIARYPFGGVTWCSLMYLLGLRALGHDVRDAPAWDDAMGHAHLIVLQDHGGFVAAADPRSEGLALGV